MVDRTPDDEDTIYFGAWVKLENDDGELSELRIVGSDEFDPKLGWISLDSPMAKALIGKKKGASIELTLPDKRVEYYIADVQYCAFSEQ